MKKVILALTIVAGLGMSSCGSASAEEFDVASVKDACGCADGFVLIANDILATIGDKTENEMEEDEELEKTIKPKFDKLDELEDLCRGELDVKLDDMKECNSELEGVMKKFEEKF
jgi:hypothetical protein